MTGLACFSGWTLPGPALPRVNSVPTAGLKAKTHVVLEDFGDNAVLLC